MKKLCVSALILAAFSSIGLAVIQFDPVRNCIWVTDFPEGYPGDLARVAVVDKAKGWGKVLYDAASDTWTVNADLWIGTDDGTDTFFQFGDPVHSKPTLILNGNLVVCPSVPVEKKITKEVKNINRFTMGDATNSNVTTTLKIVSALTNEHTVLVGVIPYKGRLERVNAYSGQFHMFNSRLTAAVEDEVHQIGTKLYWGAVIMQGDSVCLKHSTIAWVKVKGIAGLTGGGRGNSINIIEDMVFDHCGTAIEDFEYAPEANPIRGCTFQNCGTALSNPRMNVAVENCSFTSNDCNWSSSRGLDRLNLIDCNYDKPRKGNIYKSNAATVKKGWKEEVVSTRHVVIAVGDSDGNPIKGALVMAQCDQTGAKELIVTGADGKTPGRDSGKAMVLTEMMAKPVEGSQAGIVAEFTYTITAACDGYESSLITNFYPSMRRQEIRLVLRKKQ